MPRAVVGVPLFNGARHLREALDTLLAQTYRDAAFVLVDDCSTDETPVLAAAYEAADERVTLVRNERRLGLVRNWRRAFRIARERFPDAPYFAWASDHDSWEPRWLEALVAELDAHPGEVLAFPQTVRIAADGTVVRGPRRFETRDASSPVWRFRQTFGGLSPGDMVYGLFRAEALERAGVLPLVVGPDRLLLAELALAGEFGQVPEVLWRRRTLGEVTSARQRASFFPAGRPPLFHYLPWWLVHAAVLAWRLGVRRTVPGVGRPAGLAAALWYGRRAAGHVMRRRLRRQLGRLRRQVGRLRRQLGRLRRLVHRLRKTP
jgi:glycosyltransferase involved in cell wall biosynthesis